MSQSRKVEVGIRIESQMNMIESVNESKSTLANKIEKRDSSKSKRKSNKKVRNSTDSTVSKYI